jgi:phosphate transport system permease protein
MQDTYVQEKSEPQSQRAYAPPDTVAPPRDQGPKNGQPAKLWWKKKFRLGEFLVEKAITVVSFLSFTFITLIFIFVFREALPIFSGQAPKNTVDTKQTTQESYGDESSASELQKQVDERKKSVQNSEDEGATATNLIGTNWQPVSATPKFGMLPIVVGSLKVTLIAILFAAPTAILAALFTAAFAPKWSKELLKPAIEILAGIPSVVIGFLR